MIEIVHKLLVRPCGYVHIADWSSAYSDSGDLQPTSSRNLRYWVWNVQGTLMHHRGLTAKSQNSSEVSSWGSSRSKTQTKAETDQWTSCDFIIWNTSLGVWMNGHQ